MLRKGSDVEVGDSQATVATLFVIPEEDFARVQMKYHRLDGKRGTWQRPSAHRSCGGRMLRNGSDVEVGDSQATVATLFVIPEEDSARVQMKYHRLDGNRGTGRRPSARRGCGGRMLGNGSEKGVGNSRATVATLFVIPEEDSVKVQMKFHRLDGKRGTRRRPSARRRCGGSTLRNGSDVGVGDSEATVATLFVIPK